MSGEGMIDEVVVLLDVEAREGCGSGSVELAMTNVEWVQAATSRSGHNLHNSKSDLGHFLDDNAQHTSSETNGAISTSMESPPTLESAIPHFGRNDPSLFFLSFIIRK